MNRRNNNGARKSRLKGNPSLMQTHFNTNCSSRLDIEDIVEKGDLIAYNWIFLLLSQCFHLYSITFSKWPFKQSGIQEYNGYKSFPTLQ